MRTAKWSHERAVKDQDHISASEIKQADQSARIIRQGEIWCRGIHSNFRHSSSSKGVIPTAIGNNFIQF